MSRLWLKASTRGVLFGACVLGLLSVGSAARADVVYSTISEFAAGSGGAYNFLGPAINSGGTVVFVASDGSGNSGIYTGSGGAVTTIADLNTTTSSGQNFSYFGQSGSTHINDNGLVAFTAGLNGGGLNQGIFTGDGGALTTIADSNSGLIGLSSGGVNNSGVVSFIGTSPSGSQIGVYAGSGVSRTTIALYDSSAPGAFDSFGSLPGINDNGVVVFDANGATGVYTGSGGPTTTVIDASSGFNQFVAPVINNSGTTAFTAVSSGGSAIYTSANLTTPVVDGSGPVFSDFGLTSLNDNGEVAFSANTKGGGSGIYMQDGAGGFITVAELGQSFMGSTITGLQFGPQAFNESGQVAFFATLDGGRQGIYRASVVATPEPSTWAMMILGASACLLLVRRRKGRAEMDAVNVGLF